MRHFRSVFLLSVGSFALFLGPLAARADSISTLTTTSVTYCHCGSLNSWTISGDDFSVRGGGGTFSIAGWASPGKSLADGFLPLPFSETIGGPALTAGSVTLNGVRYDVEMDITPNLFFPDFIYNPTVLGPSSDPNLLGAVYVTATGPALVTSDYPYSPHVSFLRETYCTNLSAATQPCDENASLPAVYTNVSGILTLSGYRLPGDTADTITGATFTTTPEPISYGLTAMGMLAVLGCVVFRLKGRYTRQS